MKCRRDNRAIVQRYKWIVSVVTYVRDRKYSSSNKARIEQRQECIEIE